MLAALGDNQWEEYRDIPDRLSAHQVIPEDLVPALRAMMGLRNIPVHQYIDVDVTRVHAVLHHNRPDFDRFVQAMVAYLEKTGELRGSPDQLRTRFSKYSRILLRP